MAEGQVINIFLSLQRKSFYHIVNEPLDDILVKELRGQYRFSFMI